ncbi:rhotekin isoform X2 [Corythoichthys intestinalis]|uniref:rhotekin isoform X2 n=1 Tax=Corythoichthys intestinalis TaxID=161448 RepID=UPI0025A53884|nr:rhotekin isoform X2 [Corythoichthys intestinalis]XP_057689057.1 rhotekin isoform X2 [Corythoichthys intestinalis]
MPADNLTNMEEKLWILEDLNMMYIRQIALSLQDSDIQKKIDHEIRMRDGACKLLAACSQRDQALEAAKSLQTCSTRIMAYMSELQKMKEAQVMQKVTRRSSDAGSMDDRLPCKGKVAISDLRIPLMWKDTEYFKNKGELHRCAVFCLLQLGGEIFDTDMVIVDRTLTDICFDNTIVFSEAGPAFELRLELYSCCSEDDFSAGSTPRKLASKLSSSLGRSAGKKLRAAMEPGPCSPVSNGGASPLLLPVPSVPGPKYHLLAHTTLSLSHAQDNFRTHDLTISGNEECSYWLPLYGSVCCRLAAQPQCMTQQMMSGPLKVSLGAGPHNWTKVYAVLKGTSLSCYQRQEDVQASVDPAFTIAINKETRIRVSEKDAQGKAQNVCISNQYGGEDVTHTLTTDSREETHRWMEAFWQHFYDMSQWKQCCDDLMKIEQPSPRKPAPVTPKQGSLYHEMVIESSEEFGSSVSELLARRMRELELRSQLGASPTWMSLFEEDAGQRPCHDARRLSPRGLPSSDASLTSDSDRSVSPCSRHGFSLSPPSSRMRPRTLSLDAKLSTLRGRGYGGTAAFRCPCRPPSSSPLSQRSTQTTLSSSSSTSTSSSSSSNSEGGGGHSPESSECTAFSRPSPARRSLRNLRARLDPRNWLQSQV